METFLRLVVVVFFFLSTHQHHNVMLTLFVRNGAFDLLSKLNHAFLLVLKKIKSQRVNYVRKLLACIDKFKVQLIVSGFLAKNGLFKMAHLLITSSPNNSARRSDRLDPYRTTLRDSGLSGLSRAILRGGATEQLDATSLGHVQTYVWHTKNTPGCRCGRDCTPPQTVPSVSPLPRGASRGLQHWSLYSAPHTEKGRVVSLAACTPHEGDQGGGRSDLWQRWVGHSSKGLELLGPWSSPLLDDEIQTPETDGRSGGLDCAIDVVGHQSLKNFVVEHASLLPGAPTDGVSNLTPTSKFIVRIPDSIRCAWWAQIYTSSERMSLLPIVGGLRYRYH
jgi:hypothetical protein